MGQKIVKVYNETNRPIKIRLWAIINRCTIDIKPNGSGELEGDQCYYSVIVEDDDKTLTKHGVHFPSIEWIIYYQDQKKVCHLLSGTGDVPRDLMSCYQYYEIPDENLDFQDDF